MPEQRSPRVERVALRETGEYEDLVYRVNFWRPTGPGPDSMWFCDDFYLHDVDVADALEWGRENLQPEEILEVQALAHVSEVEVVAYTLYGHSPTRNRKPAVEEGVPAGQVRLPGRNTLDSETSG